MAVSPTSLAGRAAEILDARLDTPTNDSAAQWADKALAVRTRSFWSARLHHARHVASLKKACIRVIEGKQTRAQAIAQMRFAAKARGLEAWSKEGRVRLIIDMAVESSINRAEWERMMADKAGLKVAPALRFVRWHWRKEPRDWEVRWREAADAVDWEGVYDGDGGETKIALFRSPIWRALSAFDRPYPPFDFNSGMGYERVFAHEMDRLGWNPRRLKTIKAGEETKIDISNLPETERKWLKKQLGRLGRIRGNTLYIKGDGL